MSVLRPGREIHRRRARVRNTRHESARPVVVSIDYDFFLFRADEAKAAAVARLARSVGSDKATVLGLFDWGHSEGYGPTLQSWLWTDRFAALLAEGLDPVDVTGIRRDLGCTPIKKFLSTLKRSFDFSGARLGIADSHSMGFGAVMYFLSVLKLFPLDTDFALRIGQLGKSTVRLGPTVDHGSGTPCGSGSPPMWRSSTPTGGMTSGAASWEPTTCATSSAARAPQLGGLGRGRRESSAVMLPAWYWCGPLPGLRRGTTSCSTSFAEASRVSRRSVSTASSPPTRKVDTTPVVAGRSTSRPPSRRHAASRRDGATSLRGSGRTRRRRRYHLRPTCPGRHQPQLYRRGHRRCHLGPAANLLR